MAGTLNAATLKLLIGDALNELLSQKLRTFLTLLGMIFGVGAVIAMLNIGQRRGTGSAENDWRYGLTKPDCRSAQL